MTNIVTEVPVPQRMAAMPKYRGFPVPFFAAVIDGVPDFRVADVSKKSQSAIKKLCWICGQKIRYPEKFCFVGGPISTHYRLFGDGPMHIECAEFSLKICPYLLHDNAKRAEFAKIAARFENKPGIVIEEPGHTLDHPDWFYLCYAPSYEFLFVREVGHKVFQAEVFDQIDKWKNGKMIKSNIDSSEIV